MDTPIFYSSSFGPTGTVPFVGVFATTLPDGRVTQVKSSVAVQTQPAASTYTPSTTHITKTAPAPSATSAATETQQPSGPPLSTVLPAVVAPVVFVLIVASIILFTCLHYRSKKRDRERITSFDEHRAPAETALLAHKNSQSFTLPSPFSDTERIKEGQLGVWEKRRSVDPDRVRSNGDIVALYERQPGPTNKEKAGDKYVAPRVPPPVSKTMPATTAPSSQARGSPQQRPQPQQRPAAQKSPAPRPQQQRQQQQQQAPPRSAPAPNQLAAAKEEPSWPLPAGGPLPSPGSLHSAKNSQSGKSTTSRPSTSKDKTSFQLPPLSSSEPFSMREELRPDSDTYDLSTSAAGSIPAVPSLYGGESAQPSNTVSTYSTRKRESDAVSELSFDMRRKRDTDALSVVSAMSNE